MRWSEINEEGWKLPGERAKKGKGYLVPLSLLAREILDGVPRIGELVFRANTYTPLQGFDKVTARVKKFISPMKHWYIHDLRRTFATHLRSLGVERLVVSKLFNHAEVASPRYMTATQPTLRSRLRWSDGPIAYRRSSAVPRPATWYR